MSRYCIPPILVLFMCLCIVGYAQEPTYTWIEQGPCLNNSKFSTCSPFIRGYRIFDEDKHTVLIMQTYSQALAWVRKHYPERSDKACNCWGK